MQSTIFMVVIIVVMVGFMWFSSRKQKQQRQEQTDWRTSLKPGDEIATVSGLLGKVSEIDIDHDQIVIDSEGSLSRWRIQAITKPPIVPAYVPDDEVDEEGNPLPPKDEDTAAELTVGQEAEQVETVSVDQQASPFDTKDAKTAAGPIEDSKK